jgi:hypothetical protein
MAENQNDQRQGGNQPGQDSRSGSQNDRNRDMVNNPSGETRGQNPSDYNPDSPTGQNTQEVRGQQQDDPQKRITPEVPGRKEERETQLPKAEDEVYGDFDETDDAASQ